MGLIDSIIGAESGGNPNARNPNSSAAGPGQFIDSTWLSTIRSIRPDLAEQPDSALLALKTDPQLARQATEAYAQQNQAVLAKAGLPVNDGNTYLAHFAGPQGAVSVLQAHPDAPVSEILGAGVVKANPFLAKMTAADLQAWAARKVGGQPPQAAPPPQPAALVAPQPQAAPIFAQPAPAPQQAQQQVAAPAFMPEAQQPMAPIFASPRRSVDISKLRAAFKPPQFYRG